MTDEVVVEEGGAEQARREAQVALLQMAGGVRQTQLLYVAAKLGIADLLADGPKDCAQLALAADAHAPSLYRVLRALAGQGIFAELGDQRFALTPLAELLRSDVPGSVRGFAVFFGERWIWDAWGSLLHSARTGETAFDQVHGLDLFGYLASNPDAAAVFNSAMTGRSDADYAVVARTYDFSRARTVVDIGGGQGRLIAAILTEHPAIRGILFDLPSVVAGAAELERAGVAGRCQIIGGDFFESVPSDGDVYILANVIHDWDDDRAVQILQACRRAMPPGAKLLVIEAVLPPGNTPHRGKLADITMLALTGGKERTEMEFRALLAAAGFAFTRVVSLPSYVSVVEGVPAA